MIARRMLLWKKTVTTSRFVRVGLHFKVFGVGEVMCDIKSVPHEQDTRQEKKKSYLTI